MNSFYERKVECLEQILTSGYVDRDANMPTIMSIHETSDEYIESATAPWHFQSLPGTKSTSWPNGLQEFCERIEALEDLAFWNEPLDIMKYGREFLAGAREYIVNQINKVENLGEDTDS